MKEVLASNDGKLSEDSEVDLLAEIGYYSEDEDRLQWSVIYNLTNLEGRIFTHRNKDNLHNFKLNE